MGEPVVRPETQAKSQRTVAVGNMAAERVIQETVEAIEEEVLV
jgi:hypothetical protein